jgi:hypothetical protein
MKRKKSQIGSFWETEPLPLEYVRFCKLKNKFLCLHFFFFFQQKFALFWVRIRNPLQSN